MITVSKTLAIAIGAMLIIPVSAFAEEVPATTTSAGSASATVDIPAPAPTKPLPPKPILRPRIATTTHQGAALPLRTMASGTKPLPKELEERMQNRDKMKDCISQNGTLGTTTDCIGQGERQADARERMQEKRSEILKHMSEQMFKRMEAAIERLTKLSDRVDSRIQKLKEQGVDTTKSEALIKTTRVKITEATTAVEAAKQEMEGAATLADTSASSTKPVDAGKKVRDQLEKARVAITAAHKSLVAAVESLKASSALRENTPQKPGMLRVKDAHEGTSTEVNPTL